MAYQSKYTGLQIDDILDSVEWKQGKIEDLASIRAGAQKGATALQSYTEKYTGTVTGIKINGETKSGSGIIDLGTISTDISGKQDKLVDGVNIATINGQSLTAGGDLTIEGGAKIYEWFYDGESKYVLLSQEEYDNIVGADIVVVNIGGMYSVAVSKSGKEFSEAMGNYALIGQLEVLDAGVKLYININIKISTKVATITAEEQNVLTKTSQLENDSNFITSEDVAAVALSGSYNDLHDTPSIPAAVTESTVSGWGFTKNTGTYSKPSGGIPKTDLASAVQTSLGKADTAIQSTSFGELTDLAVVKGFESAQNGTVYALPDCDSGDEDDILLSRSSVKTVNGQSIVGSGDIEIGGRSENEIIELTALNINISEMLPNVIYVGRFAATGVSITSFATSDSIIDDYTLVCSTEPGLESVPISLPDNVIWANGVRPEVNSGDYFELSIRRKSYYYCAVLTPFKPIE